MIKVSIIIPIYNSQNYLRDCLESIKPNLQNKFEVILINDNSRDGSLKICKNFVRKFKNSHLVNLKKTKGVSNARNIGINLSKGEFICFLDSDDRLANNFQRIILKFLKKYANYDVFKIRSKYISEKIIDKNQIYHLKKGSKSLVDSIINYNSFRATCWNFIVNKKLITANNINFKNIKVFEDQVFVSEILCLSKKDKIIPKGLYERRMQDPHSLSKKTGYVIVQSCIKVILEICKFLKSKNYSKSNSARKFLLSRANFAEQQLLNNILVCKKNQIIDASKFLLKNSTLFNSIKKNNNNQLKLLTKNFYKMENNFLNFKMKKILIIKKLKNSFDKYIIFCAGSYGEIILKICLNLNINVECVIDNNNFYSGKKLNSKIIYTPSFLKKKLKYFSNHKILICNKDNNQFKKIKFQLEKIGLNKKNLIKINI
jgi:glycosyltransferase involved in cell wall biosynthesis